jgi:hypothetical protein
MMSSTPLEQTVRLIPFGSEREQNYICYDMLIEICNNSGINQIIALETATRVLISLRLEGVIDTLAQGEPLKSGRRAPWSRKRIAAGEVFLADYERDAVSQLQSIVMMGDGNVSSNLLNNLGLAMTYLWGLHDKALVATKDAVTARQITVRPTIQPGKPPSDIA